MLEEQRHILMLAQTGLIPPDEAVRMLSELEAAGPPESRPSPRPGTVRTGAVGTGTVGTGPAGAGPAGAGPASAGWQKQEAEASRRRWNLTNDKLRF